jgi:hypothetical protein
MQLQRSLFRMKRILGLTVVAALAMAASAWAGPLCLNGGVHCICPPAPDCPDCSNPCDRGFHHCSCRKSAHAHDLIEQLSSCCCCDRIKAAKKLGSRLHADFCCDPEVLSALVRALLCDSCWEVRQAAAWSIAYQHARTDLGVGALYLSSKIDPHYLVRDAATDALDMLWVCRKDCFKDTIAKADALAASWKGKYKPGQGECPDLNSVFGIGCCAAPASTPTDAPPAGQTPAKTPGTLEASEAKPLPQGGAQ